MKIYFYLIASIVQPTSEQQPMYNVTTNQHTMLWWIFSM